jgi:beta-phosphoglucomutase-like phosphatase (HAD superfamily)
MNILLDFDGVIFNNKRVHTIVADRSVNYVQRRLNLRTAQEARYINSSTYPVKGHTALIFEDDKTAIHDYNKRVFDDTLLYQVRSSIDSRDHAHANRFISLRSRVPKQFKFHLCTNATLSYCEHVLNELNMPMDYEHVFTSDGGMVKPKAEFWTQVEDTFPEGKLTLIDDSPLNILGVMTRDRWDAVLINEPADLYRFLEFLISQNF